MVDWVFGGFEWVYRVWIGSERASSSITRFRVDSKGLDGFSSAIPGFTGFDRVSSGQKGFHGVWVAFLRHCRVLPGSRCQASMSQWGVATQDGRQRSSLSLSLSLSPLSFPIAENFNQIIKKRNTRLPDGRKWFAVEDSVFPLETRNRNYLNPVKPSKKKPDWNRDKTTKKHGVATPPRPDQ